MSNNLPALTFQRGSSVLTPAMCTDQTNKSVCALTDCLAVPALLLNAPPTTYVAAVALPPVPIAKRGLDLLLSAVTLSKDRSMHIEITSSHGRGEACPPRLMTMLRGIPLPI